MRSSTATAFVIGTLVLFVSDSSAQEAAVKSPAKEPLQIIDECVRAVQQQDYATYVDHLSPGEQKMQAGYVLLLSSTFLPTLESGPEQIEPEALLLLRAFGDLIKKYANEQSIPSGYPPALPVGSYPTYSSSQGVSGPRVREVLMTSAAKLKDPRLFLIDALTELTRPVQVAGAVPTKLAGLPDVAELSKVYQRRDWVLYTRGEYAIAVPKKRETEPRSPVDGPQPLESNPAQSLGMLRIEFQKIEGVWKISHILPIAVISTAVAETCAGPDCNLRAYTAPTSAASYYPSSSVQATPAARADSPMVPGR